MKIGDMLVKLREKKDITRKQLASLAGIQYHALAKYEQNVAAPNIETLIQLANIFNVTIDELVGRDLKTYLRPDNKKKPAELANLLADPEATWCGEILTEKEKSAIKSIMALRETQPIQKSCAA